jgi:mannose-6-phosphate isomerase
VERVWGCTDLSPWFPAQQYKTGEVWFQADFSPLLIKFIFTSEDLSVQVHPDDEYAQEHHDSCGKTEMWHILEAEPGARIATGLRRPVSRKEFITSLRDGRVQDLLHYREVNAGDSHLIAAGVVHMIGAGIRLCEIQQNCDITYRLYDYGRPRELHLYHGLNVARLGPYDSKRQLPVQSKYFRTDAMQVSGEVLYEPNVPEWVVMLDGEMNSAGFSMRLGEVWEFEAGQQIRLSAQGASALRVSAVGLSRSPTHQGVREEFRSRGR